MQSLFEELVGIMEAEKDNLMQLSEAAREHHRALRQLDMIALAAAVRKEEEVAALLRRQEERRRSVASILAGGLGLPENTTLGQIVEKAPSGFKEILDHLREIMKDTARELAETNEINSLLTRQAMRVNEVLMKAAGLAEGRVYASSGRVAGEYKPVSLLDKKV